MQACGDVMIGQHGRSVHEAIPHNCGAKAIPTSLLPLPSSSPRIKIVNQLNQRLCDELYIPHDTSISREPHLLTRSGAKAQS